MFTKLSLKKVNISIVRQQRMTSSHQTDQRRVNSAVQLYNAMFSYQLFTRLENIISILAISQITFSTQSIFLHTSCKNVTILPVG